MRRFFLCLVFFLLVDAFSLCWSERTPDLASTSKGLTTNTCDTNPGSKNPYSNKRFSLPQLTASTSSGTSYVSNVDIFAWGDYNCALYVTGNLTSGEDPSTEDTILGITISNSAGAAPAGSYRLVSFRLNNYLPSSPGLGFVSCQNNSAGVTPCDNQAEDDYSPVPEPAPIAGDDGNSSLWAFGNIFQLSGTTSGSTPNGPPMQLTATPPDLAAALLVPGCAPDPAAMPPINCIGTNSTQYSNGLSPQTTYTVTLEDTSSGQILVLGTPSLVQAAPGQGHDVFSAASYNPVTITTGIFANQLFDLSGNYPQLDGSGAPNFNGFAESAFPPPCATNSGICTADDTFANVPFHAMWFDFVPTTNNPVSINTAHSHFDTILSVFTGGAASLQAVANGINDDNPNATIAQGPRSSAVVFQGTKGVAYHILVSEYPAVESVDGAPDPGFDIYEAPLSSDPILNLTLTTPQLTVSPATLSNFGSVTQGMSSGPQVVTLAAVYSAASSGISNISPSMTAGLGDFQIASNSSCLSSLADQATCTLNIVFTPTATGARSGILTVSSSSANSPLTLSLSGTGLKVVPILGVATTPVAFGDQLLGTASNINSVVLTNTGTGPLTVTAVKTTGDFSETTNCSSIAIGAQCSVAVGFTPTQTGARSGQLSITDNVGSSPQFIALSGTGTDFALQGAAGSQLSATMASGTAAVYNVAVTPLSGFTGMVALSCTGAPAGSSCTTSAASVNVTGAAVPVTVSVTTTAATLAYPQSRRQHRMGGFAAVVLPLGTFALMTGKRRRRLLSGLFCLILLVYVSGFVGCGSGNAGANVAGTSSAAGGGTSPVTSMLTLSGVSGTQTRTVSLTLTVQ
jgi:HYDIN/CFA65/VesB-like, Ig-like domain